MPPAEPVLRPGADERRPPATNSGFTEAVLALERAIDLGGGGTSAHRLISLVSAATDIDELTQAAALVYKPQTRELIQSRIDALKSARGDAHPVDLRSQQASAAPRPAPPQESAAAPRGHGSDGGVIEVAIGAKGAETVRRLTPGNGQVESFSDCPQCPEMVAIPSGQAVMGSQPEQEGARPEESPAHRISVRKPLALSKYPVSVLNWRLCVDAGACRPIPFSLLAVGQHVPITRVSWFDAKAYVEWLSQATGRPYRLLSEAEREYAARAGARRGAAEAAVRSDRLAFESIRNAGALAFPPRLRQPNALAPNGWGLHAMGGNVFEWVEDCWHGRYERSPSDGSAWLSSAGGDCAYRVVRGGSGAFAAIGRRQAARAREFADTRAPTLGFRVARELSPPTKTALDVR
jgi:formylglycine-generating enzyme required for sulfatase activity